VIVPAQTDSEISAAVEVAAAYLRRGEVIAIPTETVYGLAANAFDAHAVQKIFAIKNRPPTNPLIVHVASFEMARQCAGAWPAAAEAFSRTFWPGPLTIVVERSSRIPDSVTAGGDTVGLRWPAHRFVQELIAHCGFPLAAPSANLSGEVSPTTAHHVWRSLGDKVPVIIDGGRANVGIESTVVDASSAMPRLLRPGIIPASALSVVSGKVVESGSTDAGALRSPGLLLKHYAPKARLVTWRWENANELREQAIASHIPLDRIHVLARLHVPERGGFGRVIAMPRTAEMFAKVLYAELHASDDAGADLIVVEAPPQTAEWEAIWDRLRRAAA
jgi:L-threonylcarbamoyladenylate synthase